MKEYLLLYQGKFNKYYYIPDTIYTTLYDLYMFMTNGYPASDPKLFTESVWVLNITYIVNDLENEIAYVGVHYDDPDDPFYHTELEDFNETNSCKISHDNFKEFIQKWIKIKRMLPPFAIIYRDDNGWIHSKGFDSKEEMELFVKNYQPEETH